MGAPAGLKLNTPLTTALGSFFLYHVQLWGAFITLVTPTVIAAIQLLLPMGCVAYLLLVVKGEGVGEGGALCASHARRDAVRETLER